MVTLDLFRERRIPKRLHPRHAFDVVSDKIRVVANEPAGLLYSLNGEVVRKRREPHPKRAGLRRVGDNRRTLGRKR